MMEGGVQGIVIVISSFMIQMFVIGISGCIGVYNIEFLEYFVDAGAAEISIIAALNFGVALGSGPIVSFLMSKFAFRKIAIGGSLLVIAGLLSVPLLPYLGVLYLTLGVLLGFGNCCAYIPSHTLTAMYYEKNRSLATAIAKSGTGFGFAVMPVVVGSLIDTYSWKGSFVILGGLFLHLLIFAGLLRDPPPAVVSGKSIKKKEDEMDDVVSSSDNEKKEGVLTKGETLDIILVAQDMPSDNQLNNGEQDSLSKLPFKGSIVDHQEQVNDHLLEGDCKPSEKQSPVPETARHIYIFKNFNFDVYFLNNLLLNTSRAILVAFMPEYLRIIGGTTSLEAAWLTGFRGLGSLLGCIIGGVIGNVKSINRIFLFVSACFLAGLNGCLIPVGSGLVFYGGMISLNGFLNGVPLGLLMVVLTDLIGIESLGNGMGYMMLAGGLGSFIGPLFAGFIIDNTGDLNLAIYFAGILAVSSGLVMAFVPLRPLLTCKKKKLAGNESR